MAALPKHYLVSLGLKEIPRKTSVVWYDGHVSCKAINIHMERRESFKSHLTNWTHRIYVLIKQFVTKIKLKQQTIKLPIFAYTGFFKYKFIHAEEMCSAFYPELLVILSVGSC